MKKITILTFAILLGGLNTVSAQYTAEKEYRIKPAYSKFSTRCIECNQRNSSTSDYKYLINVSEKDNEYQNWQIIPIANKTDYYNLKNAKSKRYMSTKGTWVGNYLSLNNTSTKATSTFAFKKINSTQVAITFTDEAGTERYLRATDSAAAPTTINITKLANSPWAWKIVDADEETAVEDLFKDKGISITVRDHRIFVSDTEDYKIYDTQGRPCRKAAYLLPGAYIVVANGKSHSVMVE